MSIENLKLITKRLQILNNKLKNSDYKIIKCYEYSLAGLPLPYDIQQLHSEREKIREQIRQLNQK